MTDFKEEVDCFVNEHGIGAHFEYKESGRKKRDTYGKPIVFFDNRNTITKLAELLAKHAEEYIRLTKYSKYLYTKEFENSGMDVLSYYYEAIYDIAPGYNKEYGKSFSNYFIDGLNGSFHDMYKKDKVEDKEGIVKSRLDTYYISTDDDDEIEKSELGTVEKSYLVLENKEYIFEIALQIIKVLGSLQKTQASMSRIFFTDDVIYWIEGESDEENLKVRHANEIFEQLEKNLLEYIMNGDIYSLIDILTHRKKTYKQLQEYMNELTSDEDILQEYRALFQSKLKDKEDLTKVPPSPLGNNMLLAYMYYSDYLRLKDTDEKPIMHASSYITKYQNKYKEILDEFINI